MSVTDMDVSVGNLKIDTFLLSDGDLKTISVLLDLWDVNQSDYF